MVVKSTPVVSQLFTEIAMLTGEGSFPFAGCTTRGLTLIDTCCGVTVSRVGVPVMAPDAA